MAPSAVALVGADVLPLKDTPLRALRERVMATLTRRGIAWHG
jgi:hypothetical protein